MVKRGGRSGSTARHPRVAPPRPAPRRYLALALGSFFAGSRYQCPEVGYNTRSIVLTAMVCAWALRLSSFLFRRVNVAGKDGRFDEIKINPPRFLVAWTLQGLWCFLTALPVFTVNATGCLDPSAVSINDWVGWAIWALGWGIEIAADDQKRRFAANPANRGKWIEEGLWYYSRHPNYFGEITLWVGVFVSASTHFRDTQWALVFSPCFVALLLLFVSGVPLLEKRADEKWGADPAYQLYKANTSVLWLWPKGSKSGDDLAAGLTAAAAPNKM
jgi:steroid 5-alpha reductase family enzyme